MFASNAIPYIARSSTQLPRGHWDLDWD
jgi:hypothetical protein